MREQGSPEYKYRINEFFAKTKGKIGVKDQKLADAVGMSNRYIEKVRLNPIGSNNAIDTDLLIKIAAYFECEPHELLNYESAAAA